MVNNRGFTLIEMAMVVGIIAVVATILLFQYPDFSNNISISNLSQEIGLSIRKAQSYATSVRSIAGTNGVTSDAFPSYGIAFSMKTSGSAFAPTTTNFVLFTDELDPSTGKTNNTYDNGGTCGNPTPGSECLENFTINDGDYIKSICLSSGSCITSGTVDVLFHRPAPDATICLEGTDCVNTPSSYVDVKVSSPKGITRDIFVYNTGQISAQ